MNEDLLISPPSKRRHEDSPLPCKRQKLESTEDEEDKEGEEGKESKENKIKQTDVLSCKCNMCHRMIFSEKTSDVNITLAPTLTHERFFFVLSTLKKVRPLCSH